MKNTNNILNLISSLVILFYFTSLIIISYYKYSINTIGSIVLEITTIPLLILTLVLYFYNFKKWYKENWKLISHPFLSIFILTLAILVMIFATIYNI